MLKLLFRISTSISCAWIFVLHFQDCELLPYMCYILSLPKFRIIRFIADQTVIFGLMELAAQSYFLLKTGKKSTFFQYSSFYLLQIYVVVTIKLWVLCFDNIMPQRQRMKNTFFWSLTMCSEEMRVKLHKECRLFQFVCGIVLLLTCLLVSINLYLWYMDYERYYILSPLIIKHVPGLSAIFHWTSIIVCFLSTIPIISAVWYTFYMLAYLRMQMFMLVDQIQTFGKYLKAKKNKQILPDDNKHQENVARHLNFFIKRHQSILEFRNFLKCSSEGTNFLFMTASIFVSLYTVITVYSELFNRLVSFLALLVFWVNLIVHALICQYFVDSSEELERAIYDLEWYFWNIRNMKIFLVFHKFITSRKITIPMPSFVSCNVEMVKWFAKAWYSVSNVLHTMKTR